MKGHAPCVSLLIQEGAAVNAANSYAGDTALHKAARNGHDVCVSLLLSGGAAPNAQNNKGDTPLHDGAQHGREDTVSLLVDGGANVNVGNKKGMEIHPTLPTDPAVTRHKTHTHLTLARLDSLPLGGPEAAHTSDGHPVGGGGKGGCHECKGRLCAAPCRSCRELENGVILARAWRQT